MKSVEESTSIDESLDELDDDDPGFHELTSDFNENSLSLSYGLLGTVDHAYYAQFLDDMELLRVVTASCSRAQPCLTMICSAEDRKEFHFHEAIELVRNIRTSFCRLNKEERRDHLVNLMSSYCLGVRGASRRLMVNYSVSHTDFRHGRKFHVCKKCFCNTYGISEHLIKTLATKVKTEKAPDFVPITDRSKVDDLTIQRLVKAYEEANGPLSKEQLAALQLPRNSVSTRAYMWMKHYFNLMGDKIPNCDEIHLESCLKMDLWREYVKDCLDLYMDDRHLSYTTWLQLWEGIFPHVRIREFKKVTGKCQTCAQLSFIRQNRTDSIARSIVSELHAYHRMTYMGERNLYYERVEQAVRNPKDYMSIIWDGMAQNNSELPWEGNLHKFSSPFGQHLMGMLEHGQEFVMYRSFPNLSCGSNLAIHCFLMQLERRKKRLGELPPTLYIQIDGGPENANKYLLAMCSLIVSRVANLGIKKIVLSRLPVGHTHEDIDSKFAMLWLATRNCSILTPQDYKSAMEKTFTKGSLAFKSVDIFAIPDYKAILEGYIDKKFKNFRSGSSTQSQFIFKACRRDAKHPLGVDVTYKAYAQDEVFEIITCKEAHNPTSVGLVPQRRLCPVQPAMSPWDDHEVVNILLDLPREKVVPQAFVQGWREQFESTLAEIRRTYGTTQEEVVVAWDVFSMILPQSDDVYDYLRNNQLPCPLFKEVFGNLVDPYPCPSIEQSTQVNNLTEGPLFRSKPIRLVISNASIDHSGKQGRDVPPPITVLANDYIETDNAYDWRSLDVKTIGKRILEDEIDKINKAMSDQNRKVRKISKNGKKSELLERIISHNTDKSNNT